MKPKKHEVIETLKAVFKDLNSRPHKDVLMEMLTENTNHIFALDEVVADYVQDSLELMQLLADIEEKFDITIGFRDTKEITPRYLLNKIESK